jgi:hypothetical protein
MYGPMVPGWGPMPEWMWQLHLAGAVVQAVVLLALLVGLALAFREREAAQPKGR